MPSSSPMNYRSSPADAARFNREVSSPLRQMTNTQSTQEDGDRTPRASGSGLIGGKCPEADSQDCTNKTRLFSHSICS
jgi:DNA replication licensing factor MCM4